MFQPAIDFAVNGFTVSNRTAVAWLAGARQVREAGGLDMDTLGHFDQHMFGESPPEAGERAVNPNLGRSLGVLASTGCSGFYGVDGPVDETLRYARSHGSPLPPQLAEPPTRACPTPMPELQQKPF